MPKLTTVELDEKQVIVKKLPIGEYVELIQAVKKLPKHLQSFENLSIDKIIEQIPIIAGDCLPDLLGVISIATKLEVEEIAKLGLDEIVKLIEAIFEVNNYSEVFATVKKALAHPAVQLETKNLKK